MGRRPRPEIRDRLLDGAVRHLLHHGLPAPPLRLLADELDTSARMLIYHFGTKEKLVAAALIEARRRQRALFDSALTHRPPAPYADTLAAAWSTLSGDEGQRYVRLFSSVHALPAGDTPWPAFPAMATADWLPLLEAGMRADDHPDPPAYATLALAVARGLLLDRRSTGDHARAEAARTGSGGRTCWNAGARRLERRADETVTAAAAAAVASRGRNRARTARFS